MPGIKSNREIYDKENISTLNNVRMQKSLKQILCDNKMQNRQRSLSDVTKSEERRIEPRANPQIVQKYQGTIMCYLRAREPIYQINFQYLKKQQDISHKMRSILIDWIVDVCSKYRLLPQTLFMTVNLIDRYLAQKQVLRQHLQLIGVACLMIVGKFEEIYPPVLKDYVSVCDNAYTKEQILAIEADILVSLDFDITQTSSFSFLQLIQQKFQLDEKSFAFARYILENALLDIESLKYGNLFLATGALFLVNRIFKRGAWNTEHCKFTGVDEKEAKRCARDLFLMIQRVEGTNLTAVKRKFWKKEFFEVSRYRIEKVSGNGDN